MDDDLKTLGRTLVCFFLNPPVTPELVLRLLGCLFAAWLSAPSQKKDDKK